MEITITKLKYSGSQEELLSLGWIQDFVQGGPEF